MMDSRYQSYLCMTDSRYQSYLCMIDHPSCDALLVDVVDISYLFRFASSSCQEVEVPCMHSIMNIWQNSSFEKIPTLRFQCSFTILLPTWSVYLIAARSRCRRYEVHGRLSKQTAITDYPFSTMMAILATLISAFAPILYHGLFLFPPPSKQLPFHKANVYFLAWLCRLLPPMPTKFSPYTAPKLRPASPLISLW